jgi:hypothetical protein
MTRNGLIKVYFAIPPICTFLSKSSSKRFLKELFSGTQQEAINKISSEAISMKRVLKWHQNISRISKIAGMLVNNWEKYISFSLAILIAYTIFEVAKTVTDISLIDSILNIIGLLQLTLAFMVMLGYFISTWAENIHKVKAKKLTMKNKRSIMDEMVIGSHMS